MKIMTTSQTSGATLPGGYSYKDKPQMTEHSEAVKLAGDLAAASISIAAVLQWLPAVAASLTIVWTLIRIYDWAEARWRKGGMPSIND